MKKLLRVSVGLPFCVVPMLLATYIWLWSDDNNWIDSVGKNVWYLASGQWDRLPD